MRSSLSTPPAVPSGSLAARPQPTLSAPDSLLLRPWESSDAAAFYSAYQDPEIRHWHRALDDDPVARAAYDGLAYSHKREHVRAIESAKKPETRRRRIEKAIVTLRG